MLLKFKYKTLLKKFVNDFEKHELKNRKTAAALVRKRIKAKALKIKKTGTLAKGVYAFHNEDSSYIGIHAPAYHNYLVEFGHRDSSTGKFIQGTPIVYPTFEESTSEIIDIMNKPMDY